MWVRWSAAIGTKPHPLLWIPLSYKVSHKSLTASSKSYTECSDKNPHFLGEGLKENPFISGKKTGKSPTPRAHSPLLLRVEAKIPSARSMRNPQWPRIPHWYQREVCCCLGKGKPLRPKCTGTKSNAGPGQPVKPPRAYHWVTNTTNQPVAEGLKRGKRVPICDGGMRDWESQQCTGTLRWKNPGQNKVTTLRYLERNHSNIQIQTYLNSVWLTQQMAWQRRYIQFQAQTLSTCHYCPFMHDVWY